MHNMREKDRGTGNGRKERRKGEKDDTFVVRFIFYHHISSFLYSCEELLELHGRLISKKQLMLQEELLFKFSTMTEQLAPLLEKSHQVSSIMRAHSLHAVYHILTCSPEPKFGFRTQTFVCMDIMGI